MRNLLRVTLAVCVGITALWASRIEAYAASGEPVRRAANAENGKSAPHSAGEPALALTLADAVFIGLRKNPSIRSAYIDREAQRFDLKVAEDVFTPHAVIAGGFDHAVANGAFPTDSASLSPTVVATTPIGTNIAVGWTNTATRMGGASTSQSVLTASFVQPLLKGAGTEVNTAPVKVARLAEDINKLNLRATIAQTVTSIILAYRTLLTAEETRVVDADGVKRAQALLETDAALIQAGRLAKIELVQAQAALENQKLTVLQDELQAEAARLALAALLDINLATRIKISDGIEIKKDAANIAVALDIAFKRRPDYLAQADVVEQSRLGIVVAENQRLLDLSLVGSASYGRQNQILPGFGSSSSKVANAAIGVVLTAPLNDLAPEQNAIHANVGFRDAEIRLATIKSGVEQQVRLAVRGLELTWGQVEVARKVETLALASVEAEKLKLNAGRSSTFMVQILEANYRASRLQRVNAEINYMNSVNQLDLQLGTTLDTWKIAIRE